jgi:hypothetical protein
VQRFVVEPILFSIFGELLYPNEPVEYLIPYSSIVELYEMVDNDHIVTDPAQNEHVKKHIAELIQFFEQPFVKKKIDRTLRVPWTKSAPILFSEQVTLTVYFSIDNAEFGELFDPIETELLLLARRENAPIISDQLDFNQRVIDGQVGVTVIDVADFGFFIEEEPVVTAEAEETLLLEPLHPVEAEEGAFREGGRMQPDASSQNNPMLPWVMGGIVLMLVVALVTALI